MVQKSEHTFEKMNITPLGMNILIFLARNPNKEFYVRELAKILNKSLGGVHKTLKSMATMGLISEKKSGKNVYFQISQRNPSIKNFKVFMTINELLPLVHNLKDFSGKIILYGSCTTGEDTISSDIDLLVLTTEKENVKKHLVKKIRGRDIQPIIVNTAEFMKLKEQDKAFYREVNKGIILWDGHHE